MPRRSLGPRLYLDPVRRTWAIRDGAKFVRLGLAEAEREDAEKALADYNGIGWSAIGSGEHVYFLQAGGRLKIGRARNVEARIDALRRMSPVPVRLLWAQPGGSAVEASYHRRFVEYRTHGEWFEIRGSLADFLDRCIGRKGPKVCHGTETSIIEAA